MLSIQPEKRQWWSAPPPYYNVWMVYSWSLNQRLSVFATHKVVFFTTHCMRTAVRLYWRNFDCCGSKSFTLWTSHLHRHGLTSQHRRCPVKHREISATARFFGPSPLPYANNTPGGHSQTAKQDMPTVREPIRRDSTPLGAVMWSGNTTKMGGAHIIHPWTSSIEHALY